MGRCCCIMTCDDNKQRSESKFLLINRSNTSIFPEDNRFVFILIIGALISGFSGYWYYVNAGRVVLAVFLWILTVLFLFFASWVSNNHSYLALKNIIFIIFIFQCLICKKEVIGEDRIIRIGSQIKRRSDYIEV